MPVAVITDSTACIPEQLAAQWGIAVVQVQIAVDNRIDDENRFDRSELIEMLRAGHPVSTRPPDPGAFFWAYQDAVSAGADAIVSLHISGKLSETVNAAREAAQQIRVPVYVLDSGTTSMSLGFAALSAARTAAAGGQVQRVLESADRRYRGASELIFVDTLEYLRRGGRIGAASALFGTALSIKPLLTVEHGEVAPLARVPGARRALAKVVDLAAARAANTRVDVAVACAYPTDREMTMVQQLRKHIPAINDIMLVQASTVIAAHVGPGALGVTISPMS